MEQYDLLLNIAARKEGEDFFTLTISTKEGKSATAKIIQLPWDLVSHAHLPEGAELGTFLYNILVNENCWTIVYDHVVWMEKDYAHGSLLLEIEASEFFQLPWEDIFFSPELLLLKSRFQIVRYLSSPSTIVTRPLKLPIDVLIVSDSKKEIINRLPTEKTLRYFRATKATGISTDRMKKLLSQFEFDIVHVTGMAVFDKTNSCVFFPGIEGEAIKADEFGALLKNCKARFLVLHCTDGLYGALLHFAHLLLHRDGPTILVTAQPYEGFKWITPNDFNDFDNLYIEIVHNTNLAYISPYIPKELRHALLLASGGGDVLSISMQVSRLKNQFANQVLYASHVLERIHMNIVKAESIGDLKRADKLREHLQYLGLYIESNEPEFNKELNYAHETGGMEPLKKIEAINTEFARRLKNIESLTKRVVNCWFRSGDKIIKNDEKLEPNSIYNYDIQIGAALESSILQNATPFPKKGYHYKSNYLAVILKSRNHPGYLICLHHRTKAARSHFQSKHLTKITWQE